MGKPTDKCQDSFEQCYVVGKGGNCLSDEYISSAKSVDPKSYDPKACLKTEFKKFRVKFDNCLYTAINAEIFGGGPYGEEQLARMKANAEKSQKDNAAKNAQQLFKQQQAKAQQTPDSSGGEDEDIREFIPPPRPPLTTPVDAIKYSHTLAYYKAVGVCSSSEAPAFRRATRRCFCQTTSCEEKDQENKRGNASVPVEETKQKLTPKDETTEEKPARNVQFATVSAYGLPIERVFGEHLVHGNVLQIQSGSVKEVLDKSAGTVSVELSGTIDMLVGLCTTEIEAVTRIQINGEIVYTRGDARELRTIGGAQELVTGRMFFVSGGARRNAKIPPQLFDTDVAYRDLSYLIFKDFDFNRYGDKFPEIEVIVASKLVVARLEANVPYISSRTAFRASGDNILALKGTGEFDVIDPTDLSYTSFTGGLFTRHTPIGGNKLYGESGGGVSTFNLPSGTQSSSTVTGAPSTVVWPVTLATGERLIARKTFSGIDVHMLNDEVPYIGDIEAISYQLSVPIIWEFLTSTYTLRDNVYTQDLYAIGITTTGVNVYEHTLYSQSIQWGTAPASTNYNSTWNVAIPITGFTASTIVRSPNGPTVYILGSQAGKFTVLAINLEKHVATLRQTEGPSANGLTMYGSDDTDVFSYAQGDNICTVDLERALLLNQSTDHAVHNNTPQYYSRVYGVIYTSSTHLVQYLDTYSTNVTLGEVISGLCTMSGISENYVTGDTALLDKIVAGYKLSTSSGIKDYFQNLSFTYGVNVSVTNQFTVVSPTTVVIDERWINIPVTVKPTPVDVTFTEVQYNDKARFYELTKAYYYSTEIVDLSAKSDSFETPAALSAAEAQQIAERMYNQAVTRISANVTLAPRYLYLDGGDYFTTNHFGLTESVWKLQEVNLGQDHVTSAPINNSYNTNAGVIVDVNRQRVGRVVIVTTTTYDGDTVTTETTTEVDPANFAGVPVVVQSVDASNGLASTKPVWRGDVMEYSDCMYYIGVVGDPTQVGENYITVTNGDDNVLSAIVDGPIRYGVVTSASGNAFDFNGPQTNVDDFIEIEFSYPIDADDLFEAFDDQDHLARTDFAFNHLLCGNEWIAFAAWEQLTPTLIRVSKLLRGLRGSDAYAQTVVGDTAWFYQPETMKVLALSQAQVETKTTIATANGDTGFNRTQLKLTDEVSWPWPNGRLKLDYLPDLYPDDMMFTMHRRARYNTLLTDQYLDTPPVTDSSKFTAIFLEGTFDETNPTHKQNLRDAILLNVQDRLEHSPILTRRTSLSRDFTLQSFTYPWLLSGTYKLLVVQNPTDTNSNPGTFKGHYMLYTVTDAVLVSQQNYRL